ncbi:MAG: hypothetical protein ACE5OZ_07095 [Candidatus Heimdallarchaeota archaeon]
MTSTVRLVFVETQFVGGKTEGDIILDLDEEDHKAVLTFAPHIGGILKRTAIRQARSIVKTGFLLASGVRIGQGFTLEFQKALEKDLAAAVSDIESELEKPVPLPPLPWETPLEENLAELTRFFWEDLYDRRYTAWTELPPPEQIKIQHLLHLGKEELTNEELQALFALRAEDDRERFQERAWLIAKAHANV